MFIYQIINLINGKRYIGLTTQRIKNRWRKHIVSMKSGEQTHLYKAMRKYGVKNFKIEIICKGKSIKQLNRLENYYIKKFNTLDEDFGYNMQENYDDGITTDTIKILGRSVQRRGKYRKNCSKYVGAFFYNNKWLFRIRCQNKAFSKQFDTEEECAICYDKFALFFHGESAYLNFPQFKNKYLLSDLKLFVSDVMQYGRKHKYTGISYAKHLKAWRVSFLIGGKRYHFGHYKNEKTAAKVSDAFRFLLQHKIIDMNFPKNYE